MIKRLNILTRFRRTALKHTESIFLAEGLAGGGRVGGGILGMVVVVVVVVGAAGTIMPTECTRCLGWQ